MDLNSLPPEMQAAMLRMLEAYQAGTLDTTAGKRSPVSGPLKDLRDPGDPQKRLHRPSFFFQTTDSYTTPTEYPKVKWHQNGTDTLVMNRQTEDALGPEWGDTPSGKAMDPAERIKAEMMALSAEDQDLIRTAMRDARLRKIQEAMWELSPAEIEGFLAEGKPAKTRKG